MTKQELFDMAAKLQAQAESMPDAAEPEGATTESTGVGDGVPGTEPEGASEPGAGEVNENDEIEEKKNIEPQTSGSITDNVAGVHSEFKEPAVDTETVGVEQVLQANFDQRFATLTTQYQEMKAEMDKTKVVLSEILTRIELVQEVTDKVTTVDHDSLLTESIKLLV